MKYSIHTSGDFCKIYKFNIKLKNVLCLFDNYIYQQGKWDIRTIKQFATCTCTHVNNNLRFDMKAYHTNRNIEHEKPW